MKPVEFERFSKHLFAAFPDVWEWLNNNSPDVGATLAIWQKMLADYSLVECMHVIDDWLTGRKPIFKAYERAQIALMIRQCVQFDREKEHQRQRAASHSEEYQKTRREDYKPLAQHLPELRPIFERGAALKRDVIAGKISQHEFDRRKAELLEEVK